MNKYLSGSLCALLLVVLSGCASMGYVAPQTPAQRLAYVDTQIAVVVDKLADARTAGMLSDSQIEDINNLVKSWERIRELAYTAATEDRPDDVLGYLSILENVLVQLKAMRNE